MTELSGAAAAYETTVDELKDRILALIPKHPEIMTINSPFDLLGIEGFECGDLAPSHAQASFALSKARSEYTSHQDDKGELT